MHKLRLLWFLALGAISLPAEAQLFASVLPASRTSQVGTATTLFASVINASQNDLSGCRIALATAVDADLDFLPTDPATNLPAGVANLPVAIGANELRTFLLALTAHSPLPATELEFSFTCDGEDPAAVIFGVNTFLFSASLEPTPDIVALSSTISNDGVAAMVQGQPGVFTISAVNLGASGSTTVMPRVVGGQSVAATICETDPATSECLSPPASSVSATFATGGAATFGVFLTPADTFDLDPSRHRVFVDFIEGTEVFGSTSVAMNALPDANGDGFPDIVDEQDAQARFVTAYLERFGLVVPEPAVAFTRDENFPFRHDWTSTAYLGDRVYYLYLYADGTIEHFNAPAIRPKGRFRVAVVAINHPSTNIEDVLDSLWVTEQDRINETHAGFAEEEGLPEPLVVFENTNLLADPTEISNPRFRSDVVAFLATRGITEDDFDLLVSLDLDAENPRGGFASYGGDFSYMGYLFAPATPNAVLDASRLRAIANAVYHHEIGHNWGWAHEWTTCVGFVQEGGPCRGFMTHPELYGWTDTDGDGVIEILDDTPYGRE